MPQEKNIAEVIPAANLPRDLAQFWSYRVPEELRNKIRIGDTVKIPFRKKELLGVVASFSNDNEVKFKLRDIKEILPELGLSERQLAIARFVSEYYFAPLALVIKIIFPEITKQEARTKIKLNLSPEINAIGKETVASIRKELKNSDRLLLLHSLESERHDLYRSLVEKQSEKSQTLLLLPESFDIYGVAQFYIDRFGEERVAILSGDITKNQYFAEWQKVKNGQAKIVIGTRQAVFAPFTKLNLVIADEEHNSSFKQWDQNPRYHGVDTAVRLAEIHGAKIILSSPTPSLESYCRAQNDFRLLDISRKPQIFPPRVDMDTERKKGNSTFISEKLQEALLANIYAKKQVLIFIPRLGEKTIHQCKDCGYIAECEICQGPLIGYKNKLYCPRCKELHEPLRQCPHCQGQNINAFGGGSERIFAEVSALFEGKNIRIVQLDSGTSKDSKQNRKVFADFQKGKIDILIGTQMIWKNFPMQNLSVVAVIFPEIIFSSPGFRSREKSRQFLNKIYRLAESKTVIIQSRKIDHKYFDEIKNKTAATFYKEELKSRSESLSSFPYPPLGKLIKLVYKNADSRICASEAKWQYEILQKEIFNRNWRDTFEIMPPFPAQSFREFGKYRYHIIVKHKNGLDPQVRDALLRCVKKEWIIDVDPDEIL
ncbi:MAG: primosomal protein N' [Patescibacteria group bacterium]